MKIPIISLHQPWGNWVSLGWKTIETRTHNRFKSLNEKTIGIHLAIKWDKEWFKNAGEFLNVNQIIQTERFLRVGGAIICVADVAGYRELGDNDSHDALIDCSCYSPIRYGLFLENIRRIEAIPCKGGQGIFYNDELNNRKL